jgi:tryptophanyl-tRNA synthetase
MSKTYGNAIDLFGEPNTTRKRIMSIKTDSTPVEDPKNPDTCNVFALYRLMAKPDDVKELEERYRAGGMGYGEAKKLLAEVAEQVLGPARERREKLVADPDYVEDVLRTAGKKARAVAREVMAEVRDACGLVAAKDTHS